MKNYSFVSIVYKLFTKIIANRIKRTLKFNHTKEQAGIRIGYSKIDHIHTVNQVIEKRSEYTRPLYIAFIDYEKAFDSVEISAVMQTQWNLGDNKTFISILEEIYRGVEWEEFIIKLNGECLSDQRFADDIALLNNNLGNELQFTITELDKNIKAGLKIDLQKMTVMYRTTLEEEQRFDIGSTAPEVVKEYVYL